MSEEPIEEFLENGDTVLVYPDGRKLLKPVNRLAELLTRKEAASEAACAEKSQKLLDAVTVKREAQASGDAIPSDKRAI